jgi:hypothetical protein
VPRAKPRLFQTHEHERTVRIFAQMVRTLARTLAR